MKINQILILFLLFNFNNVMSIEPDEILKDAQLEQRAREMGKASAAAVYRRFINAQKKITAKRAKKKK